MKEMAERVSRWLGLLSSGLVIGEEAERSLEQARRVLGTERLVDLRRWFQSADPAAVTDAKRAVVEACLAVVHADGAVVEAERELMERIVDLSDLDEESQTYLRARIDAHPDLDAVVPRIAHPSLRELVLVIAWQLALADARIATEEYGAYGVLADRLGVTPERAAELRALARDG